MNFLGWVGAALTAVGTSVIPTLALAGPVQVFLDRLVKQENLPGTVLLVSGPQGRELAASGVANRKTQEAMTPNTRFYIASSGKLVTAVATLQLVQEKRLELPQRVFERVKGIKGIAGSSGLRNIQTVTLEQLLAHRSGLAEYFTDEFEAEAAKQPDRRWTVSESLAFAYGQAAQARPGREFNYTNTNYVLLGHLIEQADQMSYGASVQRRIFDPLNMSATTVGAHKAPTGLAHGYRTNDRGRLEDVSESGWNAITGDGAVVTTVLDYEVFLHALFRDAKLLPMKAVTQMCQAPAQAPDSDYGLGCSIRVTPWGEAWGHNGSISGFNADTWYLPKLGVTVVFFTNGDFRSDDPDLVNRAVRAYLKK